jgi:two-component system chemotaxis response regulator CheY
MAKVKKVLIVDDDESIRMFVAAIMEAEGWEVMEALNGQQGLDAAELETPDLIILDVDMPVMDGFEAFKRFRDSPFLGTVPIIMLTGINEERGESYDRDRMEEEFGVEGPEDFVDKPVDPVFLLQSVMGVVG